MWNEKEKKQFVSALKKLEKCNGDCKHCDKCHMYLSQNNLCYAFGCDVLPMKHFDSLSDTMKDLKQIAMEQLKFELNLCF